MTPPPKKHQTRWRVTPENAAGLERVRRLLGYRSWDELFSEMIRRFDYNAPPTPSRLEAGDLRELTEKISRQWDYLLKILGKVEANENTFYELKAELEQTKQILAAVRALLAMAFDADQPESESSDDGESKLQKRLAKRGRSE